MAVVRPIWRPPKEPIGLGAHALDNLRFIRETMERAGSFTAVPGLGGVLIGLTAICAAAAAGPEGAPRWLAVWLAEALVACAIGVAGAVLKSRRGRMPLNSGPARKVLCGFAPPLAAGALLTLALWQAGVPSLLPGAWLLLYGTGVVAGCAASVRVVPTMGLCFMALGGAALLAPPAWGNLALAAGFGGFHLLFGAIIAVKYGG